MSRTACERKWGLSPGSIFRWQKRYPVEEKSLSLSAEQITAFKMREQQEAPTREEESLERIASLNRALAYEKMRSRAFELLIQTAEREEGISILKKGGARQ